MKWPGLHSSAAPQDEKEIQRSVRGAGKRPGTEGCTQMQDVPISGYGAKERRLGCGTPRSPQTLEASQGLTLPSQRRLLSVQGRVGLSCPWGPSDAQD